MGFLQSDGGASLLRRALALATAVALSAAAAAQQPAAVSGMTHGGLHYEISGTGTDWLVLVHGFGVDERMWDGQMAAFNARFRVLRYDLPAHGQSPAPAQPRHGWEDLTALLDELGIARANVVGLSAGSNFAVDFAVVSPERVERLVLASPSIDGYVPKENMMTWFGPIAVQARAGHADSAAALFASSPLMRLYGDTAAQGRLTALIMANAALWRDTVRAKGPPLTPPALARLGRLGMPVLVIVGAYDSRDTRAAGDTIVASVKGAQLVVFARAGHVVNFDEPARFDSTLVAFLRGKP
jgi:pimeloyl-ACP methyl ester carboxylesterase